MSLSGLILQEVRSARHSLRHLLLGRAVGAVLGLLLVGMLWRAVPTENLGHYLTALAALEIVALISGLGLSGVVQRQIWPWLMTDARDRGAPSLAWSEPLRRWVWAMLLLRSALAGALALGLATTLLAASVASLPLPLLMLWFGLGTLQRALEELLTSVMLQDGVQLAALGANLLRVALVTGGLALDGGRDGAPWSVAPSGVMPWSVTHLVILDLLATGCAAAVAAGWLHRRIETGSRRPLPARPEWSRAWRIGLGFWLVQMLGLGLGTPALRLFLAHMGSPNLVAIQGAAQAVADVIRNAQPVALLAGWLRPLMVKLQLQDRQGHAVNRLALIAGGLNVLVLLPVLIVLGLASPEILRAVAGAGLASTAQAMSLEWPGAPGLEWLLFGLALLALLQGLHGVASMRCAALEQPRPALWATGLALAVLPLAIALWPSAGPWGAVAAVALAEGLWITVAAWGGWLGVRARHAARGLRRMIRLLAAALADAQAFARGSAWLHGAGQGGAQAQLLKGAHRLDKGLALAQPRPGFGQETAAHLKQACDRYEARHGVDWVSRASRDTMRRHAHYTAHGGAASACGEPLTRAGVQAAAKGDFESLVRSRRSIRQFTSRLPNDPSPDLQHGLEQAVRLALHSPSVCNRSAARVWWTRDPLRRDHLLKHQNGHHGFGHQAECLLIISTRLDSFDSVGERHQGWIDGGLFAMTLILALHHQGLGTCCLNWSVTPDIDRAFKRDAGLPRDEQVVMLLAVGHLPERFTVAHSPRRPLEEALFPLESLERST